MAVAFHDINSAAGLKKLDQFLLTRSYITGYQASKDDITVHAALSKPPSSEYVNVSRWYNHIAALLRISGVSEEGCGVTIEGSAPITGEAVATPPTGDSKAAAAAEDDDDSNVDLFGEETEEEKKAAEERAAAVKASTKKKESGKSSVLLDVKPWDDETDMKKLEEAVRSVEVEGLHWGASKLVPVGYGIKKMTIMLTIVDDLVSVDSLIEEHLTVEPINEYVQSCDIVAFNKISATNTISLQFALVVSSSPILTNIASYSYGHFTNRFTVPHSSLLLVSFVFIFFLKSLFRKTPTTNTSNPPPSPPALPVIGHLHLLSSDHQAISFLNLSNKHGPLLNLRLGGSRMLLVSSASFATEVFKTHDLAFADRPAFAFADQLPYGNSGFFGAVYGDYWKFMKKLCMTELFAPRQLERSRKTRQEEIVKFCRAMIESGSRNEVVDVGAELMKMTNNSTCKMVMSTSVSEKGDEPARIRDMMIKTLQLATKVSYGDVLGPFKKIGFWLYGTQLVDVSLQYDELLEQMLKDHERDQKADEDLDLADLLLKVYRDDKAEVKITRTQIKAFLLDLFIGGTISSTETMQWAIAELINHPDAFKKVREEINSVLADACRLVEETDIPSLPYLQAVVKEALRLYPPSPVVIRKSRQNCKIKGFDINQGTMVAINVYAIMRDPEIWDNPNEFRPERFLASSDEGHDGVEYDQKEQNFSFVAFGGGRRRCPGSSVALLLVNTAVAAMVQCFDWKVGKVGDDDDGKVNVQIGAAISLPMASPLNLRPVIHFNPFASSV